MIDCINEKYYLQTFGCQMNLHDSEMMAGILESMGYLRAQSPDEANLIILNTCCVRENAENRLFGHLGNLKPLKDKNPGLLIAVCGCMAQQSSVRERISQNHPYVDLIFGTHNLHRLQELITKLREPVGRDGCLIEIWEEGEREEDLPIRRDDPYRAWVTVIYGCNNFCSYCIVPSVRGRERSRHPEKVLAQVRRLAAEGVKEVTLLGQNVNSYGSDLAEKERIDFADLLTMINQIEGLRRIRFQTSHPKDLSERLIRAMAEGEKICEHLHLPVQAGSNRILAAMNRKYTREHYLGLVKNLRGYIPKITITTDIIVGFPGERDEDFDQTMDLVKEVGFDGAFTFAYSPRPGTRAALLPEQVEEEIKMNRLYRLIELVNRLAKQSNQRMEGKTESILVEGPSSKREEIFAGRTRGNKLTLFTPPTEGKDLIGQEVMVQIEKGLTYTLKGALVKER